MFQEALNNVARHQGFSIAIFGTAWVFFGLVLINVSVHLTNFLFGKFAKTPIDEAQEEVQEMVCEPEIIKSDVPIEHVLAIFTAIELYRKLHFEVPESRLTFKRGQEQLNGWKMGNKFGQRG